MYDKQVRRRRLALAGFVVASLLLLTVYFGESTNGGLHSVQRGALSVLGPIQEGAHRALKPFRDLFGWVGDTLDAKKERDKLSQENEDLRKQLTELQAEKGENEQLKNLLQINEAEGLDQYAPVKTLVTGRTTNLFYSKVQIEKGSSAGIHLNDPVVNGDGLVGRVTTVTGGQSIVTLLTDESFSTGVKVLGANQQTNIRTNPNKPGLL
jgi:rod shape-determining protein MreC